MSDGSASVPETPLTELIQRASGDEQSARDDLYRRVYDDLHRAAGRFMRQQQGNDLQTTALVNEVLLRFEKGDALQKIENRRMFFAIAIRAMNQVLVDHYRRRKKLVDSPNRRAQPFDFVVKQIESEVDADFDALQVALDELLVESPRQHAVIMHRFFGGLTIRATAEMLNVAQQTVQRDWRLARAKLYRKLRRDL